MWYKPFFYSGRTAWFPPSERVVSREVSPRAQNGRPHVEVEHERGTVNPLEARATEENHERDK